MKKLFLLVFVLIVGAGCSTTKALKERELASTKPLELTPPQQTDVKEVDPLEKMRQKLTLLVDEAIKSGPEAVRYISGDLYVKASDASLRGDLQTAIFLYEYILRLNPDDDYLKKKVAMDLIRAGELEKAEKYFAELVDKSKYSDESVALVLGGVYFALGKADDAHKVYLKSWKANPKNEEACVFLAKSYAVKNQYKNAYRTLDKCEASLKDRPTFAYYKGKMELERGRKKGALRSFRRALKIDPMFYQAAIGIGLIYEEKQQIKKALQTYEKYLADDPANYTVLSRLVQLMIALQKDQEVVPYLEKLVGLDYSNLNLKVRLGIIYSDLEKYESAKGVFKEILEIVPDSDKILYYLGALYQQTGDIEQAIDTFAKITVESDLFEDSSIQIAQMLSFIALEDHAKGRQENVDKLVKYVEERSEKHEGLQIRLAIVLAVFYESVDEVDNCIAVLEKVKSDKNFSDEHRYYLASLYNKSNQLEESRELITDILEKNPENADALNFLGYSLLEEGKELDKAFEYITRAIELKPDDAYIRDSLGWYYYKIGDLNKALVEIKKAWETMKTDVAITKHLAIIYQELQNYGKAEKYYTEALKNCSLESERAEVLKDMERLKDIQRKPASQK